MNSRLAIVLFSSLFLLGITTLSAETVWLDELNLSTATQGWGEPHKNLSIMDNALAIGGVTFARGFGTHAVGKLSINLNGDVKSFSARVGVDDEVVPYGKASLEFIVRGDEKVLWRSGVMKPSEAAKNCEVDLTGVKVLVLEVSDAGDGNDMDHADWADAKFEATPGKLVKVPVQPPLAYVAPYILTPPAPPAPRINSAKVFGVRPGSPFLYTVAATGERPMKFSAEHLPRGLKLDAKTGRVTGMLKKKGEYLVTLQAKNSLGTDKKKFRIVVGDQISLTPPMGWNSWNCFAEAISEDKVKSAADAMIKSGLVNHGWTYVNVDDFWQNHRDSTDSTLRGSFRDQSGVIVPNSRFPDMKGLADYIHNLGLKAGLYSSPGPWTCGGCAGSWQHEEQDVQTYAKWGFDYLKYDWCSYGEVASGGDPAAKNIPLFGKTATNDAGAIYPYKIMGKFLRDQNRDIVFSLCQYGMADVWKWGGSVEGSCWRTTGDINDTWNSMVKIGFNQDMAAPYAKPGNWNDPDILIVGQVGWGHLRPTRLATDEQYTHISLWCLLSAPLLIGCDMTKLDDFTLNLLSNDEVLALDQDELGKQATCVLKLGEVSVYEKELADGGRALGFFNLATTPIKLDFKQLEQLGFSGKQHVRDLWRQLDLPDVDASTGVLSLTVPGHGVMLYKLTTAN